MTSRDEIGTLLVLGASGDLTRRLLLPGLAGLVASDRFAARKTPLRLIGAGRDAMTPAQWQQRVSESFAASGAKGPALKALARASSYVASDVTLEAELKALLDRCEGPPAIYFALPPFVTEKVCEALTRIEVPEGALLVMEKPFGVDEKSATALNALVTRIVPEAQVFRVDHFLGRSDVLNILGIRFANRIIEPVWSNQFVESIEIVYDEDLALEGRAGYYDGAGALVDMIQSHLLQVMAVLLMEPIADIDAEDFRDAKAAVLRATRLAGRPTTSTRRARYTAGTSGGHAVPAYTREQGVDPKRDTETLAEITVQVDNWRWAGVPVTLRSGKALGTARKEAVVTFKPVPHVPKGLRGTDRKDQVVIGFKPPSLELRLDVNGPGDPFCLDAADVSFALNEGELTAYGEVLAGVLEGNPLLAVRGDNAVQCWRIVGRALAGWRSASVPMDTYAAGSDGPRGWPSLAVKK